VESANPVAGLTPYELRHLGEHLEAVGDAKGLQRLLALEWRVEMLSAPEPTPERRDRWWMRRHARPAPPEALPASRHRNAWYEAKDALGDAPGYREDVRRAWRIASDSVAAAARSGAQLPIGRELRCALLTVSMSSLDRQLPGGLVRALVERGLWTETNALAWAGQAGDRLVALLPVLGREARADVVRQLLARVEPGQEATVVHDVAEYLTEEQVHAALAAAPGYPELPIKSAVFAALASRLGALGRTEAALSITMEQVGGSLLGTRVLGELAPQLGEDQARDVLAAARGWVDVGQRHDAFAAVYPRLAQLGHVAEALEAAAEIESPFTRGEMLARLAPALDVEGCHRVLALVPSPDDGEPAQRAKVLLALAGVGARLGDTEWGATRVDEAVATLAADTTRRWEFERIAVALAREHPEAALRIAARFEDRDDRVITLALIAPCLPDALREAARQDAVESAREWGLSDSEQLAAFARFEPERALEIVRRRWSGAAGDVSTAAEIAPQLPARELAQLRDVVSQIGDDSSRAAASAALDAERAARGDAAALERLAAAEDEVCDAELAAVAARLPDGLLPRAVSMLGALPDTYQAPPARALGPRLSDEQIRGLLELAARRSDDRSYAVLVSAWAEVLSPPLVERALQLALRRRDKHEREAALIALAPHVDLGQLARLRGGAARRGKHEADLHTFERAVAVRLAQLGRPADALALVDQIAAANGVVDALRGIAPHLRTPEEFRHLERLARATRGQAARAEALAILSSNADGSDRTRLRELAISDAEKASLNDMTGELPDWAPRRSNPSAMTRVARELGGDAYERAFPVVADAAGEDDRVRALAELGPLEGAHVERALHIAHALQDPPMRDRAFATILEATADPSAQQVVDTLVACTSANPHVSVINFDCLRSVAACLERLGPVAAQQAMSERLPVLATRDRRGLVTYLRAMAPLIAALGGLEAIEETESAIDDVARWWP
jgi:hypothetical protein